MNLSVGESEEPQKNCVAMTVDDIALTIEEIWSKQQAQSLQNLDSFLSKSESIWKTPK